MQVRAHLPVHPIDLRQWSWPWFTSVPVPSSGSRTEKALINAIMIAGAGAAYLNGGFRAWEFAFTAILA
jgi:hypothetical protein